MGVRGHPTPNPDRRFSICVFLRLSDNTARGTQLGCIHWIIAVIPMMHSLKHKEFFVDICIVFVLAVYVIMGCVIGKTWGCSEPGRMWLLLSGWLLPGEVQLCAYQDLTMLWGFCRCLADSSRAAITTSWCHPVNLGESWWLMRDRSGPFLHFCKLKTWAWGERPWDCRGSLAFRDKSYWFLYMTPDCLILISLKVCIAFCKSRSPTSVKYNFMKLAVKTNCWCKGMCKS